MESQNLLCFSVSAAGHSSADQVALNIRRGATGRARGEEGSGKNKPQRNASLRYKDYFCRRRLFAYLRSRPEGLLRFLSCSLVISLFVSRLTCAVTAAERQTSSRGSRVVMVCMVSMMDMVGYRLGLRSRYGATGYIGTVWGLSMDGWR